MVKRNFIVDLIRFWIAGALSVAAQFSVLILGVEFFLLNPTFSSALGSVAGASANYTLLYYWAFASNGKHHVLVLKYLTVMLGTLALNVLIFWSFTNLAGVWYVYSQAIATCTSSVFSFFLNRHYTFVD